MPIDWNEFDSKMDEELKEAAKEADKEIEGKEKLQKEIKKLTSLTEEDKKAICPEPADRERLEELIGIVGSATQKNQKISRIFSNANKFGDIVLKLLEGNF